MFYGQSELDQVIFETFFKEKRNGFFVECGAFDGLTESTCKFFEESMGWRGLNIEPVPYAFERLIRNRPNCINENYAISDISGKSNFTNAIHPNLGSHFGNGSLFHSKEHMSELVELGCKFETFEVECVRFCDIYHKHSLPNIDLFVLDVEGHEIKALQGILPIPNQALPQIFCIEYTITGLESLNAILSPYYTYHSQYRHNAFFVRKNGSH